jgi:hypothetical protein
MIQELSGSQPWHYRRIALAGDAAGLERRLPQPCFKHGEPIAKTSGAFVALGMKRHGCPIAGDGDAGVNGPNRLERNRESRAPSRGRVGDPVRPRTVALDPDLRDRSPARGNKGDIEGQPDGFAAGPRHSCSVIRHRRNPEQRISRERGIGFRQ